MLRVGLHTAWLPWAVMSLLTYSIWGVFNGLTSRNIDPYSGFFFSAIGYLLAGIVALHFIGFKPDLSLKGSMFGLLVGLATGLGGLFLLMALARGGDTSVVVGMTSVYPFATLVFNLLILHDQVSLKQLLGICFSVIAVLLLST